MDRPHIFQLVTAIMASRTPAREPPITEAKGNESELDPEDAEEVARVDEGAGE